jgi:hypothetical protein
MAKETDKKRKILIDQKPFELHSKYITGSQIKTLVGVPADYGVWIKRNGPDPDIEVNDNEQVDLDEPGREHFFTGSKRTTEG